MSKKKIVLEQPVEMHGRRIAEITLREPTGANYLDFGDPHFLANSQGGLFQVERDDVIARYLDACVDHEAGAHLLRLLSLQDARAVKVALLSFFTRSAPETSEA